jgi:hypothetical protein
MTPADAQVILRGMIPDGFNADRLTERARQQMKEALEKILEITEPQTS